MAIKSRDERWADQECVDCGKKIKCDAKAGATVPSRCRRHTEIHKEKQEERRRRKEKDNECRVPGCKRKRHGELTTCRECALGLKNGEIEDVVATYYDGLDSPWLRRKDGSSPVRTLKKIREEYASSVPPQVRKLLGLSPRRARRASKPKTRAAKRS
jgi:hypothetical protein